MAIASTVIEHIALYPVTSLDLGTLRALRSVAADSIDKYDSEYASLCEVARAEYDAVFSGDIAAARTALASIEAEIERRSTDKES